MGKKSHILLHSYYPPLYLNVSPYCEIIENLIGLIVLRQEIQIVLSTMKSGALQEGTEDYRLAAQVL